MLFRSRQRGTQRRTASGTLLCSVQPLSQPRAKLLHPRPAPRGPPLPTRVVMGQALSPALGVSLWRAALRSELGRGSRGELVWRGQGLTPRLQGQTHPRRSTTVPEMSWCQLLPFAGPWASGTWKERICLEKNENAIHEVAKSRTRLSD